MNRSGLDVQDVPLSELTDCLQWLLGKLRVERAQWLVAQLSDRVARQRLRDIFAVALRQDGQLAAMALAISQPRGAATLLALEDTGDEASGGSLARLDAVLTPLRSRLHAAGTRFLQAAAESPSHGHRLGHLGFTHLADLAFLVLETEHFALAQTSVAAGSRFQTVGADPAQIAAACELAAETFVGTQDCPRLSDFRSTADIVESYRLSALFDPQLWRVLLCDDEPIGCLFLTQHRAANGASQEGVLGAAGAVEISYMGLLPQSRGRGFGQQILDEAARIAASLQAPRMVLAVDRQNSPAIALYRRRGWVEAAQESVWGIHVLP
ncbi:MAG: GNAT family N-acetyltransferase [Planctomycetaceae bacterium]